MVRVLEEEPALGKDLSPRAFALALSEAIAPLLALVPGVTASPINDPALPGHLGLLVLDGLIARHASFGQIGATEFLGPGDLLRPWLMPESVEAVEVVWEVLMPTRLAVLDREFANRIRHWPELAAALLDRTAEQLYSQLLQAALRQARRVDDRVLLTLWHFAARWGQVTAEGRVVRLPNVTGAVLARIVGARRQSVSTALGALAGRGAIQRRPDGAWLLPNKPPELENIERGNRVSDQKPEVLRPT
jgi:CRP-like cAMP-binding protein